MSHLVECTRNVNGLTVFFTASDSTLRDVFALDQDPSGGGTRSVLMKSICTVFGFFEPVLETPGVCLLLPGTKTKSQVCEYMRLQIRREKSATFSSFFSCSW